MGEGDVLHRVDAAAAMLVVLVGYGGGAQAAVDRRSDRLVRAGSGDPDQPLSGDRTHVPGDGSTASSASAETKKACVAVVMPTYNAAKTLERLLGSLLSGRPPRGRHADLRIRRQPLPHGCRETCLRAAPVRMAYQATNALWFSINWPMVGAALAPVASSSVSRPTFGIPRARL